MAEDAFDSTAVQGLQSKDHLELLDIIDNLRAQGLNEHVDLPQLIVCGDQSSGKSSVLAAVSGVPFPKKDNLCTRFATEVSLRRNDELLQSQITVSIMPNSSRAAADRETLDSFKRDLASIEDLPDVVEQAANAMGLGAVGSAFSSDILKIEVRGPRLPQLTIVDLPGLIHSENKFQSEEDIKLVTKLIEDYMVQERSIILAIVSAKYDYPNQIVLAKTRKVDPHGKRTLGIVTKPDQLYPKSDSETSFIALANNQDVHFDLGWHVVRNLDSNESVTINRDEQEQTFFKETNWKKLDSDQLGISKLRDRLSLVLFQQIKNELPSLISEIASAVEVTEIELSRMGHSRNTHHEKQLFVVEIGQHFRELCYSACHGLYDDDDFFEQTPNDGTGSYRLRAVFQNLNIKFAKQMLEAIPRYVFHDQLASGKAKTKTSILTRAKELIQSHRGKELPGTFNPLLIAKLFRELSTQWEKQTTEHTEGLWLQARSTVLAILSHFADDHVRESCMKMIIDPQLESVRVSLKRRLADYMHEFRRHPITYNHYLTETVQGIKSKRDQQRIEDSLKEILQNCEPLRSGHENWLAARLVSTSVKDMDELSAQNLADYAEAYYKVALKRVIDEVPAHVIEPAIMTILPNLLESSNILKLPRDTVDLIGGESEAKMKHREILQAKLGVLNRSNLICKLYAERHNYGFNLSDDQDSAHTTHIQNTPAEVASETMSNGEDDGVQDQINLP